MNKNNSADNLNLILLIKAATKKYKKNILRPDFDFNVWGQIGDIKVSAVGSDIHPKTFHRKKTNKFLSGPDVCNH